MAIGFKIGPMFYKVGHGSFLHSFFSTISYNLEVEGWGSKYPFLLKDLYQGELASENIDEALDELNDVQKQFETPEVDKVIWDIEDLEKNPPWDKNISDRINNLSEYFITSDGKNLFDVLRKSLMTGKSVHRPVIIKSI